MAGALFWEFVMFFQISTKHNKFPKKCQEKFFGGTFTFSNCHIIGLDTGSLVLIVFDMGDRFDNFFWNVY
jgi:hypothetical protein